MSNKSFVEFDFPVDETEFYLYKWSESELTNNDCPRVEYRLEGGGIESVGTGNMVREIPPNNQVISILTKGWNLGSHTSSQKPIGKSKLYKVWVSTKVLGGTAVTSAIEEVELQ